MAVPKTKSFGGKRFTLFSASFGRKNAASAAAKRLRRQGKNARVTKVPIRLTSGRTVHSWAVYQR